MCVEQLIIDIGTLFRHLFSPEILSVVVTLSGIGYKLFQSITKRIRKDQATMTESFQLEFDKINCKLKDLSNAVETRNKETKEIADAHYRENQKEILRMQLLDGMHDKRLSPTEAQYFYEKYKAVGGNSFVTAKYEDYIRDYVSDQEKGENSKDDQKLD